MLVIYLLLLYHDPHGYHMIYQKPSLNIPLSYFVIMFKWPIKEFLFDNCRVTSSTSIQLTSQKVLQVMATGMDQLTGAKSMGT